jgi:hypothetical protein
MPRLAHRRRPPRVACAGEPRPPCCRPYPLARPHPFPLPFLLPRAHVELSSNKGAAARRAGRSSPPPHDSSCPDLPSLAPNLLHLSPSLVVPFPTRNRARHHRPPLKLTSSSAPPVDPHPPVHLRPIRASGELPHALLSLFAFFPPRIRRHRRAAVGALRRPQPRSRAPRFPAPPWPRPAPPPSLAVYTALARVRGRAGELDWAPPYDLWGPVVSPLFRFCSFSKIIYSV